MANMDLPGPDDLCAICDTKRDEHGDRMHKFSMEGQLIPLDPPPKARQEAPKTREEVKGQSMSQVPDVNLAFATLMEVLAEKDLLNTKDIIRIFSGRG